MSDPTKELVFQLEVIEQMVAGGWLRGRAENYDRALALYSEDVVGFVKDTQPEQWEKFCTLYPSAPEQKFLERVAEQLNKADPLAANQTMRTFGTLGVLRHELRDRGTRFFLCQFRPDHDLNPDTLARYGKNRLRVVPELVYSPWATEAELGATGLKAKAYRIDLVLFVNGLPVATLELKSEFKQAADRAIKQYKSTRLPVDPVTKKPEPLLTFKRGALVHFAVSQYEVAMTTRLAGESTVFLPFNRGTKDGGAGNDTPADVYRYATDYRWNEVLLPDNLLKILARFVRLEIKEKEDWVGRKYKQESMIFPRYHQWDVVRRLVETARAEGPGHKYLIQHSAGSGKSNSIAWVAHQLSALYTAKGAKQFHSVIVVTDRTVLDDQLQETIYQFEHTDGVVGRINRDEGEGSKSEKLAAALEGSQPIIIVTIQTFPFVLRAIENSVSLKERCYAIIADEAHSSQSGSTARQLKETLMIESKGADDTDMKELDSDDLIAAAVASRKANANLSFLAFTATPKTKTLELFGRLPKPGEAPSKKNKPAAFHVYSMRQAIEEGFILDVLRNYTNYKVAYQLTLKIQEADAEVESRKAQVKLNQWVRLHDYNIAQKVQVIVEHFKSHVMGLLGGHAKAMVVTSSRKEAVRYKLIFQWTEVEQFCTAFFQKSKSNSALANICKPAVQRWQIRYKAAMLAYQQTRDLLERAKKTGDAVLIANADNSFKAAKKEKDALEIFKKDLGTFVRFYEFMSQIVDYDDTSLEKLSLYARNLSPLLREQLLDEDAVDLNHIVLSHYRLSKIKQQDLLLHEDQTPYGLKPGEGMGTAKARDPKEEFLSQIIARLNELFVTDHLTENDLVNYAYTVRDKVRENEKVMGQLANNSDEQALLGDFPKAVDDAILDSSAAHENQKLQLLSDPKKAKAFAKLVFDLIKMAG